MLPDYQDLLLLEPRLREVEDELRGIRDDGASSFFCSNYEWLPISARLKVLLGPGRKEPPVEELDGGCVFTEVDLDEGAEGGEEDDLESDLLFDSRVFEIAYVELSRRMPACRDCGCQRFMPILLRQLECSRELFAR
ncbi:MAG: hypothetical protein CMJ89_14720 [Planctomycetes bacterium]|jgi:hypothetical protein|nr:hypothetical protein [Planctomycetota bacterium]